MTANIYNAGPKSQKWGSFVFVADYNKAKPDIAMYISKFSFDQFDQGATWAKGWNDVVHTIKTVCDKEKCKVGFLRLSCHGNANGFKLGNSVFVLGNHSSWKSEVEKLAKYFVSGVSFVTIDACQTGQNDKLLKLFSQALGDVDVRGYESNQSAFSTSEENDRGKYVTCKVNICTSDKR